jgi:uncharacterized glyoxalase superfamily protein PhnB
MSPDSTPATLSAYFGYRDANAAIDWLRRAFGFETTVRFPNDDGTVAHAELRLGDAVIVVFSDRDGYQRPPHQGDTTGFGLYLTVNDPAEVDAVYTRAVDAGATGVWQPEHTKWGNYRCRIVDPEGFEWTFGVHRPGEPADGDWDDSGSQSG